MFYYLFQEMNQKRALDAADAQRAEIERLQDAHSTALKQLVILHLNFVLLFSNF